MMLGITKGELRIDLDLRERIILYLDQDLPLPKNEYDTAALPRTAVHMIKHFDAPQVAIYRVLKELQEEQAVESYHIGLHTKAKGYHTTVHVLTPEGKLLAEAIRRRAT